MKPLLKNLCLLFLAVSFLQLSACGGKSKEVAVNTPAFDENDPNNPNKPTPAVPPQFDPQQLKVGNFIEWSITNSAGSKGCLKWTISKLWTTQAQVKRHESRDCKAYSEEFYELIDFRFEDGLVLNHDYVHNGKPKAAPIGSSLYEKRAKLYEHFYKNPTKVLFSIGSDSFGGKIKYPVFTLKEGNRAYYKGDALDTPHPWHAVILRFKDSAEPPNAYTYKSANPDLVGDQQ